MAEWYPGEAEDVDEDGLDSSWLAGTSEYSATGGGTQPLHSPRLRGAADRGETEFGDGDTVEELYRHSLAQLTGDDHSSYEPDEQWEEGPLHLDVGGREAGGRDPGDRDRS